MASIHPIKLSYDKLPQSIKNTAKYYPEGRNILIMCLAGNAKRSELEVVAWLKQSGLIIKDLEKYKIRDTDKNK